MKAGTAKPLQRKPFKKFRDVAWRLARCSVSLRPFPSSSHGRRREHQLRLISLQSLSLLRFVDSNIPGYFLMGLGIPPLGIKILLESNPPKSRILVPRWAALKSGLSNRDSNPSWRRYVYIYIYIYAYLYYVIVCYGMLYYIILYGA